ncbi:Molybdenum cofactor sulfurase, partial [Gryllus bimaculatus]
MLGDNARVNTTIVVSTAAALVAAAVVTTWWQRRRRESGRMPTKWRRVGELAELRIYPLKSGASLTLKEAECTDIGVRTTGDEAVKLRDRFFIVINEAGVMKTCRQHPKLFFIKVASGEAGTVIFRAPDMKDLTVRIPSGTPERKNYFEMWKEEKSESVDCGDEAAEWMHKFLNLKEDDKVRLGYHQEDVIPRRDCDKKPWSLFRKQYNRLMRYDTQVAPSWFRPNFVVRGASPLAEDDWNYIKIGDNAVFQNFKPCLRCVVTTMDPETAVKDPQMQPLKTLRGLWNGDSIYVMDFGEAAAQWISQYLGLQGSKGRIHFGYFCPKYCQGRNFGTPLQHLKVDYPNISKRDFGVYCDFAPYTLITESSVKALKNELGRDGELLGPDWFRPNFIVGGSQEFEEDTWNYVKIGSAIFQNVMPCHRDLSCCIDPNTGIKSPKGEPFKTLV